MLINLICGLLRTTKFTEDDSQFTRKFMSSYLLLFHLFLAPFTFTWHVWAIFIMFSLIATFYFLCASFVLTRKLLLLTNLAMFIFVTKTVLNLTILTFPWSLYALILLMLLYLFAFYLLITESALLWSLFTTLSHMICIFINCNALLTKLTFKLEHACDCIICIRSLDLLKRN